MKAYLITSGAVFGLVTIAHIWRAIVERNIGMQPWFVLITLFSAALCAWACSLLWKKG